MLQMQSHDTMLMLLANVILSDTQRHYTLHLNCECDTLICTLARKSRFSFVIVKLFLGNFMTQYTIWLIAVVFLPSKFDFHSYKAKVIYWYQGVPRRQPHRRTGLATMPSVGAIP